MKLCPDCGHDICRCDNMEAEPNSIKWIIIILAFAILGLFGKGLLEWLQR